MKKAKQIAALFLLAVTLTFASCGTAGKGCGCNGVHKKAVG